MGDATGVILTVPFRIVDKGNLASVKAPEEDENEYVFSSAQGALGMTEQIAASGAVCSNFHGHVGPDGDTIYMPCSSHDELIEAITEMDSYHDEASEKKYDSINFKPTAAMAKEAKRGLAWREEHNRGGTAIGVARARDLSNRTTVSPRTVKRMVSYFARHEVDKKGEGWSPSEDGYPSAGRIAWALWGGDVGRSWANARKRSMDADDKKSIDLEQEIHKDALEVGDAPDIEIGQGVLIEGPVSSGVTDRDGDVVEPEAVMNAWEGYKSNPIILHNHERGGIGRMIDVRMGEWDGIDHPVPIGRALIDESEKAVVNKIRKGIIRAFSIGFIGKEGGIERIETDSGSMAYRFKQIDWVETSVVDIPSNPVALFDVVKNKEGVLVKSTAPVSFNSPFAVSIFQQESKTMTDEELEQTETTEVTEVTESVVEEPALEEAQIKSGFVSEAEFKSLEGKVNDILEGMMALKEMSSEPSEPVVDEESSEVVELKAEVASLRAEKAAAELEARIASEVEARVKSIVGDKPTVERKPERKSMAGANLKIKDSDFETVANERGVSVGAVKGEAWLATLLTSRRN
jgi:phage head maturation protease